MYRPTCLLHYDDRLRRPQVVRRPFNLAAMSVAGACLLWAVGVSAEDDAPVISWQRPWPYEVLQREEFVPRRAHEHETGGAALGFADVTIRGECPRVDGATAEYRVRLLPSAYGRDTDWQPLVVQHVNEQFQAQARVAAGGWYRLEVRFRQGDHVLGQGSVEPLGIGEVFLVAGQSYATNCNDERQVVSEPQGRVAAFDVDKNRWQIAHDPQPAPDGSDGGSIWPAFGDQLVPLLRVPVGLVNVGVGATSSGQWLPGGQLHTRLVQTGQKLGRFRAVLWQQGESDVIAHTSAEDYIGNLMEIRGAAVKTWGFEPHWLLAKSTLHPTVYDDGVGEGRIRDAIDALWRRPGFAPGPDTDILGGENRGGPTTRQHFSAIGQRRAAALWFAAVWQQLNHP